MKRFISCQNDKNSSVLVQTIPGNKIEVLGHATMTFTPEQATSLAVALNAAATEIRSITPHLDALVEATEVTQEQITTWTSPRTGTHPLAGENK